MDHTHMVLVWPNDDGTITLSQRFALGHHEPGLVANPPRVAKLIDPVATSVGLFSIIYFSELTLGVVESSKFNSHGF